MRTCYLFSGLGADERAFQRLNLPGAVHVRWIPPRQGEPVEAYAARLLPQLSDPEPILIGLSFGGMVAVEVAKHIPGSRVLLIASAATWHGIPPYYRLAGRLRLHRLLPPGLLKWANPFTDSMFGVTSPQDRLLLKGILADTDPVFLRWAMDQIVRWRNETLPAQMAHIHGTRDRVLPVRFSHCDHQVEDGGHLMTLTHAEEVNTWIEGQLGKMGG